MTNNVFINRRKLTVLFSIIGTIVISFFNIANVETVTTVDDDNNRMTKLLEYRAEKTIKVLIARTVSPTEIDNVLADVNRILSYSHPSNHERYLSASLSQCSSFHNDSSTIDLFNGSDTFPNYILCDVNRTQVQGNNYYTVKADFLLFARSKDVVEKLTAIYNENITIDEEDKINVLDVTNSPVKLWNWIAHLSEERLYGYYDYVWMVDGDIQMSSLNWHSYWQMVKIIRPMVVQPAIIGTGPAAFSSNHPVMRQHGDRRVIAAETAIVEMMVPMLEVDTWLGYRNAIASQTPLTQHLQRGGEGENLLYVDTRLCQMILFNDMPLT